MRVLIALFLLPLAGGAEDRLLEGYVFREADGNPPRRSLMLELIAGGRTRYNETSNRHGGFAFEKVREGRYRIRARFNDFVIAEDFVTVAAPGKNFIALMLPKRRAGTQGFGTVSAAQLAAQSNPEIQRLLRAGARCAVRNDWAGAAAIYERAAAAGAQADVQDALGVLYQHLGRTEEASRAFETAIRQDPKYLLSYSHLASAYLEQRRFAEVASVARRALAVDAAWTTGYAQLADAEAGLADFDGARRSAEEALRITQGRAAAPYLILTKILWNQRDCAGAGKSMRRYLDLNTSARGLPEIRKSLEMLEACTPAQHSLPSLPRQ